MPAISFEQNWSRRTLGNARPSSRFILAGRKTNEDWAIMRQSLVPGGDVEAWRKAARDYFEARLEDRYLRPIKWLQRSEELRGEGFSIVAIQCTLIEFLESTIKGKIYKYRGRGEHVYSDSKAMFVAFLTNRVPFQQHFTPEVALDFYKGIRCGLLHEAQTKRGWRIRAESSDRKRIISAEELIVYRNPFQRALISFIAWYKEELTANSGLQAAFIRKFDNLSIP